MKKILNIIICFIFIIGLVGCTNEVNTDQKNDISDVQDEINDEHETIDAQFASMPNDFFNTKFSKDENNMIYFGWSGKVYRANSDGDMLEVLFSADDFNLIINNVKYYNNNLYLSYLSLSKDPGIGRIDLDSGEFTILFESKDYFFINMYFHDRKMYVDAGIRPDEDYVCITFDINSENGTLTNFRTNGNKSPLYVQSEYVKSKYADLFDKEDKYLDSTIVAYDNSENVYLFSQGNDKEICKLNLRTGETNYYTMNGHYGEMGSPLDIIDDKVYASSIHGIVSFDLNFENMNYIIKGYEPLE